MVMVTARHGGVEIGLREGVVIPDSNSEVVWILLGRGGR